MKLHVYANLESDNAVVSSLLDQWGEGECCLLLVYWWALVPSPF